MAAGMLIPENGITSHDDNESHTDHDGCETYSKDDVRKIRTIYIIFTIIWIILIFILDIPRKSFLILVLLTVPVILALVAYNNVPYMHKECENLALKTNTVTIMIVSAAIISQWKPFGGQEVNKHQFYKLLTAAFIILMLSVLDVWVPEADRTVVIHAKVSLQGIAIVILIIAIYSFFEEITGKQGY